MDTKTADCCDWARTSGALRYDDTKTLPGVWLWSTGGESNDDGWSWVDVEVKRCPDCGAALLPLPDSAESAAARAAYQRYIEEQEARRAKDREDAERARNALTPEQRTQILEDDRRTREAAIGLANNLRDSFGKHCEVAFE